MNYSLPKITINYQDFLKGQNIYDSYPAGGIKKISDRVNVFYKPGYLTTGPARVNKTTNLQTDPILSFWKATPTTGSNYYCVVGGNGGHDGYFYSMDDQGELTLQGSADTTQDYVLGFSDSKWYQGYFYTTSKVDVIQNGFTMVSTSRDLTFWTVTKAKASGLVASRPHPMLVYSDILFIADGNYLHSLDGATATENVFDIPGYTITALTEYRGFMYIAAEPYVNADGANHGGSKIFTWNGYSNTWIDEWNCDRRIGAMVVMDNVLYCFDTSYMNYFSGGKLVPMRPLLAQVYPSQVAIIDNSMFFSDSSHLIRYGSPIPGGKKLFSEIIDPASTGVFMGIIPTLSRRLVVSERTSSTVGKTTYISDVNAPDTTAGASAGFYFNERNFIRPVKVRSILIETEALGSGQSVIVRYLDDNQTLSATYQHDTTSNNLSRRFFDVVNSGSTTSLTPYIQVTAGAIVKSVTYFYEASEVLLKN